jgi:hypothetical protein
MKNLIKVILATTIPFSFIGCAYHTTRSYTYGSNTQPVFVVDEPFYRSVPTRTIKYRNVVNPNYQRIDLRPDYPPYRQSTPHIYVCQ